MIDVYGELAEPSRRSILGELRSGPKTVSELVDSTGLKQPNVSNHLARMRIRGTVRASKVGRLVYYALASPEVETVVRSALVQVSDDADSVDLRDLAHNFAELASNGDDLACSKVVEKAMSSKAELPSIYLKFLDPSVEQLERWLSRAEIDAGQFCLAATIAERAMARVSRLAPPARKQSPCVAIGNALGSWRTLRIRLISDYLRAQSWNAYYLGASVPKEAFGQVIRRHSITVAIVGCDGGQCRDHAQELLRHLRHQLPHVMLGLAGSPMEDPEALLKAGVSFAAVDLSDFVSKCLPLLESSLE